MSACFRRAAASVSRSGPASSLAPRVPALLMALLLALSGCAGKQAGPAETGAYLTAAASPVSEAEMARRMRHADYILIGERHAAAADHLAQARLLDLAAREGLRPVVGLEMLPVSRHDQALADFIAGKTDSRALPDTLDWQRNWGFDFSLYQPLFETARRHGAPLYGLNLPNEARARASAGGLEALPFDARERLPEALALPLPEQRERLVPLFLAHAAMREARQRGKAPGGENAAAPRRSGPPPSHPPLPDSPGERAAMRASLPPGHGRGKPAHPVLPVLVHGRKEGRPQPVIIPLSLRAPFERFLLVQSLWDGVMAARAAELRREHPGRPVVIIAGGGHVEYGHGIAYRLRLLEPEARILSILPLSEDVPEPGAADLFYVSPTPAP